MGYEKRKVAAGTICHVMNRGVDKRKIFMQQGDYFRFIHDLFEFNDTAPVNNLTYFFEKNPKDIARPYIERKPRELLVEILAFCLMPNHYHLLLKPRFDDGVTKFMKKLNMGYAKYFNEKYKRSGALFQGRYKSVAVVNEPHFIYLPYYIHLNPLDLVTPEWREQTLRNPEKAIKFLETYRWSSHLDYAGQKNFPSVTQRNFLTECFGGPARYKPSIEQWLHDLSIDDIQHLTLE